MTAATTTARQRLNELEGQVRAGHQVDAEDFHQAVAAVAAEDRMTALAVEGQEQRDSRAAERRRRVKIEAVKAKARTELPQLQAEVTAYADAAFEALESLSAVAATYSAKVRETIEAFRAAEVPGAGEPDVDSMAYVDRGPMATDLWVEGRPMNPNFGGKWWVELMATEARTLIPRSPEDRAAWRAENRIRPW